MTVTANLTLITDCDAITGWTGPDSVEPDNKVQGTNSVDWYISKNGRSTGTYNPTGTWDLSDANTHLYFWINCSVASYIEPLKTGTAASSGITVRLTDTGGNYREWHVTGSDVWDGAWTCFVVDTRNTSNIYAQSGTMSWSTIDSYSIYVDATNSGNLRNVPANFWMDVIRAGTGLTITGVEDLASAAAIDENTTNRYGILQNIEGTIFSQGRLQIGDGATSTTFTSDNESLVFRGDFPAGGYVSDTLYQVLFDGSGCTADLTALSVKAAGTTDNARYVWDANDTNITYDMVGCSLTRAGLVSFTGSGNSIYQTIFNDCLQVDPANSIPFENNTISNYGGTDGAIKWPGSTTVNTCTFIDNSRAIEVNQTTDQTYNGLLFSGENGTTTYATHLDNGGTSITINKSNGSNPLYYVATGGGVITYAASISIGIHVEDQGAVDVSVALVYIDEDDTAPYIINTTTDANGDVSGSYSGAATTGTLRIRKYGYKPYKGTVALDQDINLNITLISDPQQTERSIGIISTTPITINPTSSLEYEAWSVSVSPVAEYLINEAETGVIPTTVIDSAGTNDLSIIYGTYGNYVNDDGRGIELRNIAVHAGVLQLDPTDYSTSALRTALGSALDKATIFLVARDLAGTTNAERAYHLGSDSGNGDIAFTVDNNGALECRLGYDNGTGPYIRHVYPSVSAGTHVFAFQVDLAASQADKLRYYVDGVGTTEDTTDDSGTLTSLDCTVTGYSFNLFNRHDLTRGPGGQVLYFGIWDSVLSDTEIEEISGFLAVSNDVSLP